MYKYFVAIAVNGKKSTLSGIHSLIYIYNIRMELSDYNGFGWECEFSIKSSIQMRKSNGHHQHVMCLVSNNDHLKWDGFVGKKAGLFSMLLAIECKYKSSSHFICEWVGVFVKGNEHQHFFSTSLMFTCVLLSTFFRIFFLSMLFLHRR